MTEAEEKMNNKEFKKILDDYIREEADDNQLRFAIDLLK